MAEGTGWWRFRGSLEYADAVSSSRRGRDRSEHGAKRSKEDSPTATRGSRAAQRKIQENSYGMTDSPGSVNSSIQKPKEE